MPKLKKKTVFSILFLICSIHFTNKEFTGNLSAIGYDIKMTLNLAYQ